MTTIHKYELQLGMNLIEAPSGMIPVRFSSQRGSFFLWGLVNTDLPTKTHRFEVVGTGHEIKAMPSELLYVGGIDAGPFVWHCVGFPDEPV